YFNGQLAPMLWYHTLALGIPGLNIAAALKGMNIIGDPTVKLEPLLPPAQFKGLSFLGDRRFNTDAPSRSPTVGDNPDIHPYWDPEYFGNVIMVNGKAWPNMNVQRRQYRFRIVDGSNARFYNLSFSNGMSFVQIAADGSYLPAPVTLKSIFVSI